MTGKYRPLKKIADGGTAEIYLAEREGAAGFRRLCVLKRIRPELYTGEAFRQMLLDEAHLAMGLHHSNIVQVLDLGLAGGRYFMVLELVDGWTLAQLLKRGRLSRHPLPATLAVYIASEVCRALSYAHTRTRDGQPLAIVHRDVCPFNVLVSETADVKLTDFGIAKTRISSHQTGVGVVKGKPGFMSPEQAQAQPLDARSDLFSLGSVLYALLADEFPFKGESGAEKMNAVARGDCEPLGKKVPTLPKPLVKVVERAMATKLAERFQSAEEMLRALEKAQREHLEPAGRSELETWIREVGARDGAKPLSQQLEVEAPPAAPKPDDPSGVWIQITGELNPSSVAEAGAPRRRRSKAGWLVAGVALAGGAYGAWRYLEPTTPPAVTVAAIDAGAPPLVAVVAPPAPVQPEPAPAPEPADAAVEAVDAGGEVAVVDAPPEAPDASAMVDVPTEVAAEASEPDVHAPPVKAVVAAHAPAVRAALTTRVRVVPGPELPRDRVTLYFESTPPGATVTVDQRALGKTPVTLKFKAGTTYAVEFVREGQPKVRQLLTVMLRANGKAAAWFK